MNHLFNFLGQVAAGGGGNYNLGMPYGPGVMFEKRYRAFSMAAAGREEAGDKILLPPAALAALTTMQVQFPMAFELSNSARNRKTHAGVLEFTAEEGRCYMPFWVMQNLLIEEGAFVDIKNVQLPKGNFVKFRPHSKDFLDISNPRAVLERQLRTHSCLTKGDVIAFQYTRKTYYMDVLELKPADAVSIVETDIVVDFAPPSDYVEPDWKGMAAAKAAAGGGNTSSSSSSSSAAGAAKTNSSGAIVIDDGDDEEKQLARAMALSVQEAGTGGSGKTGAGSSSSSSSSAAAGAGSGTSQPSGATTPSPAAKPLNYVPFGGPSRTLRADGSGDIGVSESKPSASPRSPLITSFGGTVVGGAGLSSLGSSAMGGTSGNGSATKPRTVNKFEAKRQAQAFQGNSRSLKD